MPHKPKTFSARPSKPKSVGGSAHLRDRSAVFQRMRDRILATLPLCAYCRASGLIVGAVVLDHRIALSLGGDNSEANLIPSCRGCNDDKSKAERAFSRRGYDPRDIGRDPDLASWLSRADWGMASMRASTTKKPPASPPAAN